MRPLDRFLMLEQARPVEPDADEAPHHGPMSARFGAVTADLPTEAVAPPPPAPPAPLARDPFAPPPEREHGYELESRDRAAARATIRCLDCGLENARYEHDVCGRCGARLDTRPVRQLNERLHQDERAAAFFVEQAAAKARAADLAAHAEQLALAAMEQAASDADERLWIDQLADRFARGPLARVPVPLKRLVAVAVIGGSFGLLYAATGSALVGFLFAVVVVTGLCMVPM